MIKVSIIVAMSENRVIGIDNQLPWHLPNDLKYFKKVTMGKPIVMGRNTFESINKPLPGRTNIVITRDKDYLRDGIKIVHSLDQAIELAENICATNGCDEMMIIGGGQIYALSLPRADRLYLTQVHTEIEGDAYFPSYADQGWQQTAREDFFAEGNNPYDYSFIVMDKVL